MRVVKFVGHGGLHYVGSAGIMQVLLVLQRQWLIPAQHVQSIFEFLLLSFQVSHKIHVPRGQQTLQGICSIGT